MHKKIFEQSDISKRKYSKCRRSSVSEISAIQKSAHEVSKQNKNESIILASHCDYYSTGIRIIVWIAISICEIRTPHLNSRLRLYFHCNYFYNDLLDWLQIKYYHRSQIESAKLYT